MHAGPSVAPSPSRARVPKTEPAKPASPEKESGEVQALVDTLCSRLQLELTDIREDPNKTLCKLTENHPHFPPVKYYDSGDEMGVPPDRARRKPSPDHCLRVDPAIAAAQAQALYTAKAKAEANAKGEPAAASVPAAKPSLPEPPKGVDPYSALIEEPMPVPENGDKAPRDPRPGAARAREKKESADAFFAAFQEVGIDATKSRQAPKSPNLTFLTDIPLPAFHSDWAKEKAKEKAKKKEKEERDARKKRNL